MSLSAPSAHAQYLPLYADRLDINLATVKASDSDERTSLSQHGIN